MSNPPEVNPKPRKLLTETADRIERINARLIEISGELRESQPSSPGSVTLDHVECGRSCLGCPHPRWNLWFERRTGEKNYFLARRVTDPKRRLRKSGKFRIGHLKTKALVDEAVGLIAEREVLMRAVGNLSRTISMMSKPQQGE